MSGEFPLITTKQYEASAIQWLQAIVRGEDVCVIFAPKTDRDIRLGQLVSDAKLQTQVLGDITKYHFQSTNFDAHNVEDMEDLYFQIEERLNAARLGPKPMQFLKWIEYFQKHDMKLILILREAEQYLNETDHIVLSVLSDLVAKYSPVIRLLGFYETDITHPSVFRFLPGASQIYENIFYYPLYPKETTEDFIDLLSRQWHVPISDKEKDTILKACGGHFWLAKEVVRHKANTGTLSLDDEGLQFRLRAFYSLLLPTEQSIARKLAFHQLEFTPEEELSLTFLKRMNIVSADTTLQIGAIKQLIKQQRHIRTAIEVRDGHVCVNDVQVDSLFPRKELRAFRLLLERKNTIISRDDIAKSLWPVKTTEQYSDWAIDQIIARLRKRLEQMSLPSTLIKTIRGKGYTLQV